MIESVFRFSLENTLAFKGIICSPGIKFMDTSFSPLETFKRAINYWWLIFLLMLLGGLSGWAIHLFKPAVYEASAAISFAIDYGQTGQLTDVEEDQMLGLVGDVIASPQVINSVIAKAQQEGLNIRPGCF